MPHTNSGQKRVTQDKKRRLRNKSARSLSKTAIIKAESAILSAGSGPETEAAVLVAIKSLDKAAEKGIIPANNAARRKSRLMKKLNEAGAPVAEAPAPEAEPESEPESEEA